jgi:hypothetical protein
MTVRGRTAGHDGPGTGVLGVLGVLDMMGSRHVVGVLDTTVDVLDMMDPTHDGLGT